MSNGDKLEGVLNKIYDTFLQEITNKVELLKSENSVLENKIKESLEEYGKILSEKEERINKIRDFLNNTDLKRFEDIKRDFSIKIEEIDKMPNKVAETIDKDLNNITKIFEEKCNFINNQSSDLLKVINKNARDILEKIQKETEEWKKGLKKQVEVWQKSLEQEYETLTKRNDLFMKTGGTALFTEYIRNNAYNILWNLFLGLFSKSKKEKELKKEKKS